MKQFLPLLFLVCSSLQLFAQAFPYSFSVKTEPFEFLSNGTLISDPSDPWDDPVYQVPLGFEFTLWGIKTDTIYFNNDNGAILYPVFLDEDDSRGLTGVITSFAPYGPDLLDRGYDTQTSLSPITYQVSGEPGSQIGKLEYKNAGFYDEMDEDGNTTDSINFQVWFYEGSNALEIHFGPNKVDNDSLIQDLFGGLWVGFYSIDIDTETFQRFWYLKGEPANPILIELDPLPPPPDYELDFMGEALANDPVDGTVYRFDVVPVSTHEQMDESLRFSVFPSPAHDAVQLQFGKNDFEPIELEVVNASGQQIMTRSITQTTQQVDCQHWAKGMYFVRVQNEAGVFVQKMLKE